MWDKASKSFSPRFSLGVRSAATCARDFGLGESKDCSWCKLKLISDFLQSIVVSVAPPSRLNPKSTRSRVRLRRGEQRVQARRRHQSARV
jgi:hypothetical protein